MMELDPTSEFDSHVTRLLQTVDDEELRGILEEHEDKIVELGRRGKSHQSDREPIWSAIEKLIEKRIDKEQED